MKADAVICAYFRVVVLKMRLLHALTADVGLL
jgi:hypothetical protein